MIDTNSNSATRTSRGGASCACVSYRNSTYTLLGLRAQDSRHILSVRRVTQTMLGLEHGWYDCSMERMHHLYISPRIYFLTSPLAWTWTTPF